MRMVNRWWIGQVSLFVVATAVWGCTAPDGESISGDAPVASATPLRPLTRLTVDGPVGALLVGPAVSPDGQTIAFRAFRQGQSQIYVHSLSDVEAVPLLAAGEGGHGAGFSPDGHILLVTDRFDPRILRRVPLAGGPVTPIGEGGSLGGSWGPDDTIVLGSDEGLWLMPASGGAPTPLTTLSDGEEGHWLPQFLPSGRAVLFFIQTGDRDTRQVAVYDFDTDERRTLLAGTDAGYATSGHLVFWRDGALWAVRFDPDRLEVSGAPVAVLEPLDADPNGDAWYAISREGTLVYIPPDGGVAAQRSLVWVDRRGQEEPIGMPRRAYAMARLSPDGRRIAANTERLGDLFLYDRETQVDEQFTFDPGLDIAPVWTPDGSQIVFASTRHGGVPNLYVKSADGSGAAARLTTTDVPHIATGWADDGETLLVAGGSGMSTLRFAASAAPETLLETDHNETPSSISPNGRWLAYVSDASGVRQVYVRPFPDVGSGGERVVSDGPAPVGTGRSRAVARTGTWPRTDSVSS